jgi:hypothetical protein
MCYLIRYAQAPLQLTTVCLVIAMLLKLQSAGHGPESGFSKPELVPRGEGSGNYDRQLKESHMLWIVRAERLCG